MSATAVRPASLVGRQQTALAARCVSSTFVVGFVASTNPAVPKFAASDPPPAVSQRPYGIMLPLPIVDAASLARLFSGALALALGVAVIALALWVTKRNSQAAAAATTTMEVSS